MTKRMAWLLVVSIFLFTVSCKNISNDNPYRNISKDSLIKINDEITFFLAYNDSIDEGTVDSLLEISKQLTSITDTNTLFNLNLARLYFLNNDTVKYINTLKRIFRQTNNSMYSIQLGVAYKTIGEADSSIKYIGVSETIINTHLSQWEDKKSNVYTSELFNLALVYCISKRPHLADTVFEHFNKNYDTADMTIHILLDTYRKEGCGLWGSVNPSGK